MLHPEAYFRKMLRQGVFMLQRCTESGRIVFYPRAISPYSGRSTLEWVEASGLGVVYSTTVVHRKAENGGDYNVALIDLAEGGRIMSRVDGIEPGEVVIGMPVQACISFDQAEVILAFRPHAH